MAIPDCVRLERKQPTRYTRPMVNKAVNQGHLARRTQGLRPVRLWVLDTREAAFVDEYRRQCRLANAMVTADPDLKEWDAWIDAEHREIGGDLDRAEQRQ